MRGLGAALGQSSSLDSSCRVPFFHCSGLREAPPLPHGWEGGNLPPLSLCGFGCVEKYSGKKFDIKKVFWWYDYICRHYTYYTSMIAHIWIWVAMWYPLNNVFYMIQHLTFWKLIWSRLERAWLFGNICIEPCYESFRSIYILGYKHSVALKIIG